MQRRGFPITGSLIFAAGIAVALVALGGDTSLTGPDHISTASPLFEAGIATHGTRIDLQMALEFPNVGEIPVQTETGLPQGPAPTRSSFIASWQRVNGAMGYRLDVSTNSWFNNYVNGYHDLDVGNVTGWAVTGLDRGTTYYYRVRVYDATGPGGYSGVMTATTVATTGLIIHATFDSSITGHPNAAAIQAMINRAISIYESLFSDPITVQIRYRYSTTEPNGDPIPQGFIARSTYVYYTIPWNTYINALRADAKTNNDTVANASLPGTALSANILPSSAGGRVVGLNTPPAMFANGTVGTGGPYDGIVTLNSASPYQFTRPTGANYFDAQRLIEHETDEVIGLGSHLNITGNSNLRPQDLFSWSSAGVRNLTSSGTRYFSINSGSTNIVNFNQDPGGDFGDWLSTACPQTHPYVQNAFTCPGQSSDIAATSPEGINLDVIGYDLASSPSTSPTDFNGDGHPDYVLYNAGTQQTTVWYLNNNVLIGSAFTPTLPAGWIVVSTADFNRDGHPDYALFRPSTRQTVIWYFSGVTRIGSTYGPTPPSGWALVATGDFNSDGKPDYVLYNASTHQTVVWYLNNNVYVSGNYGPTLPAGWNVVGVADFNGDGKSDYLLFNASTRQTVIYYLSGTTRIGSLYGPTPPAGWSVVGVADFNGDGKPDYLLFNASTRQTVIYYMNNNVRIGSTYGPALLAGWTIAAP
jgi:hypothetical protein